MNCPNMLSAALTREQWIKSGQLILIIYIRGLRGNNRCLCMGLFSLHKRRSGSIRAGLVWSLCWAPWLTSECTVTCMAAMATHTLILLIVDNLSVMGSNWSLVFVIPLVGSKQRPVYMFVSQCCRAPWLEQHLGPGLWFNGCSPVLIEVFMYGGCRLIQPK